MPVNANQLPEGPRRRIVIPLNQAPSRSSSNPVAGRKPVAKNVAPGSPRKSRVVKILAVFAIIIVAAVLLAAGGGFLWWQHYQTTPTYSVALLVDAAQRNDMTTVDRIADMDKVVDNFVAQVTEKAAGRYGVGLSGEMRKAIGLRVPGLLPLIKRQVRDAVAARIKEISARADQKPFFIVAMAMPYFVHVTTVGGEVADATITVQDRQVVLELTRSGDAWTLVSVHDDALVQQLVDDVIKDLPSIAPNAGSEFRKKLGKPPAALRIP